MIKMGKSQVSVEFMFAVGIIFVIFLAISLFVIDRNYELGESEIELDKRNTCLLVSSLLSSAFVNGDGIIIEQPISHNATINKTHVNGTYKAVDCDKGYNLLAIRDVRSIKLIKGTVRIENKDGYIDIENV